MNGIIHTKCISAGAEGAEVTLQLKELVEHACTVSMEMNELKQPSQVHRHALPANIAYLLTETLVNCLLMKSPKNETPYVAMQGNS